MDCSLAVIGAMQTASLSYTAPILEILQTRFMPRHKRECSADRLRDAVLWAACSHSQPFFGTESRDFSRIWLYTLMRLPGPQDKETLCGVVI